MYICTEDAFPNRRLVQMVSLLQQRCSDIRAMNINFTDNIYVEHCADVVCISCLFCTLQLSVCCRLELCAFCTQFTVFIVKYCTYVMIIVFIA